MSFGQPAVDAPAGATPLPNEVTAAEQKVEAAAPAAVRPEVEQIASEFNAVAEEAVARAPEAEAKAAKQDPAVDKVARDAAAIAAGGKVDVLTEVKDASALVHEVKAGYKTTEFWGSAAVIVLTQLGAIHFPGKYGATIAQAALGASYILSRGLAKLGAKKA